MDETMLQSGEIIAGVMIAILIGFVVTSFIECAVPKPNKPENITDEDWSMFVAPTGSGKWIGFFERILSFICFSIPVYTIIGGWFAFKLAAKWEVWKNVVQVPSDIENISPLAWYQARKAFGSWLLSRFLIGTLINVLIGAVSVYLGRWAISLISLLIAQNA